MTEPDRKSSETSPPQSRLATAFLAIGAIRRWLDEPFMRRGRPPPDATATGPAFEVDL